jgi:cytosine/adenosine deaminase-related metal-dependent hydrolase
VLDELTTTQTIGKKVAMRLILDLGLMIHVLENLNRRQFGLAAACAESGHYNGRNEDVTEEEVFQHGVSAEGRSGACEKFHKHN